MKDRMAANYYASTHPALMTGFFAVAFCFLLWYRQNFDLSGVTPMQQRIVLCAVLGTMLFYALKWIRSVHFTAEGLEFRFLFWRYRFLPWSRVAQVGTAKEYKAARSTLVITPDSCPVFDTASKQRTVYVERHHFRLVRLDATKQNLEAVQHFYGPLAYETEKW